MACLTVMVGKVKAKRTRRFRFRRKDENRSPGRGREYEERGEPRKRGRIYRYEKERSYEQSSASNLGACVVTMDRQLEMAKMRFKWPFWMVKC